MTVIARLRIHIQVQPDKPIPSLGYFISVRLGDALFLPRSAANFFDHACEASLIPIRPACEHRYTLPTVAPFVLASAGVVGDVSRPALLPHMLYMQHAHPPF